MLDWWTSLDTWIFVIGALTACSCALLGNYLVLRGVSMMGDAISHAVLPGLAAAFLITGSRGSMAMLAGALVVGVLTALLIQVISRYGKMEEGASMGVVFTTLFAVGLILIRQAASRVDLDPGCVLYGAIELTPLDTIIFLGMEMPRAFVTNLMIFLLNAVFVILFFKELKITSFDPALATSLGINSSMMHYLLMALVATTTVASFQIVGSILVIAMLIVPGATAFLLTRRLSSMLLTSLVVAVLSAFFGHVGAVQLPRVFGFESDTTTAGMMATASGALFTLAWFCSPQQGIIMKLYRRISLSYNISRDDILAWVYRYEELRPATGILPNELIPVMAPSPILSRLALWELLLRRRLEKDQKTIQLSERGRRKARHLVRSHRLWEGYLVEKIGLRSDHVHGTAERLEHFTTEEMQRKLSGTLGDPKHDPHEKEIPSE